MVWEWNVHQLAKVRWCQRQRWHHLPYVTHIAALRVRHVSLTWWWMTSQSLGHY